MVTGVGITTGRQGTDRGPEHGAGQRQAAARVRRDPHHGALVKLTAQKHGEGFEVQHIDPALLVAVATRQVAITGVTAGTKAKDSFEVRLARGATTNDGEKVAA